MKRVFTFFAICSSFAVLASCHKQPFAWYGMDVRYTNETEHTIYVEIHSISFDIKGTIKPSETIMESWYENTYPDPSPFNVSRAVVTFDGKYTVTYSPEENFDAPTNLCNEQIYRTSENDDTYCWAGWGYSFTEADYNYAVSVNAND